MTEQELAELAVRLGAALAARGWQVATAESCTGGWVAKALTDVAGSSAWFGYGFVTYSNAAKQRLLQVSAKVLEAHGAVSEPVVRAMAEGARSVSGAEAAVAVSGVAGPGGGTADKPVGLVWFAWASPWSVRAESRRFEGGRDAVRRASVAHALQGLIASVEARGEARETRSAAGEASREAGEASREAGEALPEAGEASPEAGQRSSEAGGGAGA